MSSPYYRAGSTYWDNTNSALYVCTTSGYSTASGLSPVSVWKLVSGGGGGSVGQYTFCWDDGDFIVCTAAGTAPLSRPLTVSFADGATVGWVGLATAAGISVGMIMTGAGVPAAGVAVTAVNTSTNVVTVASFTASADNGGNYTFTASVKIAKPPKIRCSITSETYIDGSGNHTYTYAPVISGSLTVAYTRTNTWSAGSETEQITPAYLPGDIVYAMTMPSLNMPVSPGSGTTVAVSLLDIHTRYWAT